MILDRDGGCTIVVRVQPGAKVARVVGPYGDAWKVAVAAPPVDGRANDDVCALLARIAGVPTRDVTVLVGATNRSKTVFVVGVHAADLAARVAAAVG